MEGKREAGERKTCEDKRRGQTIVIGGFEAGRGTQTKNVDSSQKLEQTKDDGFPLELQGNWL